MTMKICIDEYTYEGSASEIMEQLRQQTFDPAEYPDTESYVIRATGLDCSLPESDTERQAQAMFGYLAKAGALTVLEE